MNLLAGIVIGILFGGICYYVAPQRGRDPLAWFIIGLFLGIIGLIILLILPPNTDLQNTLSEKNGPPPSRSDFFQNSTIQEEEEIEPPPPSHVDAFQRNSWYYLDKNHQQAGPTEFHQLGELWKEKAILSDTYVWTEGMANWEKIEQIDHLEQELINMQKIDE